MESTQKQRMIPPLRALLRLNKRQYPWLVTMLISTSLEGLVMVAMGWAFAQLVDYTLGRNADAFAQSAVVVGCILALTIGFSALSRYSAGRFSNTSIRGIREKLGRKFAAVGMPWMERQRTGDLLSLLGNDVGSVTAFFEEHLRWFIGDWVRFGLSLAFLITLNPWLTLATVAYIPVGAIVTMLASKPVQKLAEQQNTALGSANAIAQDAVSGQAEVKAFHMAPWLSGRYGEALRNWLGAGIKGAKAQAGVDAVSIVNVIVPFFTLTLLGLWFVSQGRMTGGELVAFLNISNGIVNPLMSLTWRLSEIRKAAGASERILKVLDAPEERQGGGDLPLLAGQPILSFKGVRFSYERPNGGQTARQAVFAGLDLDIAPGETVAVVGPSGSGKSTLLKLAAGLFEPEEGQVLFGGYGLGQWDLQALRAHMAIVDQDTYLFPGTIGENVACGALGRGGQPRLEDVARAVHLASLDGFVATLPEGLETAVGERGSRLSGGQRQRVAIARAALRDASLLLMDEPTSALDTATEQEIQRELMALMEGRTVLIVTHKLSMAKVASRIVVLDGGVVVEQGTHGELMDARGLYHSLYSQQTQAGGGEAA